MYQSSSNLLCGACNTLGGGTRHQKMNFLQNLRLASKHCKIARIQLLLLRYHLGEPCVNVYGETFLI